MDAVVTAGGIPQPDELLYPYTQGKPKAMLDLGGKPMVQWVLDALSDAKRVENVVLIGLTEESGVTCSKPLSFIPNRISMIENLLAGINKVMELNPSATQVLLVSSDFPGITPEIWEKLIASRKNPVKQAAILGFDTLFLMLLRMISLDEAVKKVAARLHITGRAVICPYAEIAMDIDKPHQLELMRAALVKQETR